MKALKANIPLHLIIVALASFLLLFVFVFLTIPKQTIFYYDMARDAFNAYSIWNGHHLKIQGPSTDIPNLYHGVVWYYFIAIPYAIGNNNPQFTAGFMATLLVLTIPLCGYLTQKLFHNKSISISAMLLYAMSPLFISFTHWVSNPMPTVMVTPLLLIALWSFFSKPRKITAVLIGLGFGLLIQFELAFAVFLLTLPIYYLVFKNRLKVYEILSFLVGLFIGISTIIIAYIKFHTNFVSIFGSVAVSKEGGGVVNLLLGLFDQIINLLSMTYFPFPKLIVLTIIILTFWQFRRITLEQKIALNEKNKQIKFLLIWLTGIFFLFLIRPGILSSAIFFFAPVLVPLVILTAFIIFIFFKQKNAYKFIYVLLIFQVVTILLWSKNSYSPFFVSKGMFLSDEEKVVDYTYRSSSEPFTIDSITNPLFINTTWAFLYEFYGENKYLSIPYWGGKNQAEFLGDLQEAKSPTKYRYLIIEPTDVIPPVFVKEIMDRENAISDVVEEKEFGAFKVQKRIYNSSKITTPAKTR